MATLQKLREVCTCSHDKDTHVPEVYSSGDATQERKTHWGQCLGVYCECKEFEMPKSSP